jgi:N-methylhydantoinase B/oxoprolinase/acetone carboxylase alpha subunit
MMNKSIVNVVIAALKEIEINGEMMEHIIDEVGMRDQMIKQLTPQPQDVLAYDKDVEQIMVRFTRQQLINFTREIQERCKQASLESIKNAGIGFEDMVELELDYDKQISVEFDERSLYSEIENAIYVTFETDDEAVLSEITNVLEYIIQK